MSATHEAAYRFIADPRNKPAVPGSIAGSGPQAALVEYEGMAREVAAPAELARPKEIYFAAFPGRPSRENGETLLAAQLTSCRFARPEA